MKKSNKMELEGKTQNKGGLNQVTYFLICLVAVLINFIIVLDQFNTEVERLEYCQDIGFDGYSFECEDWTCIQKQHYCSNFDNNRTFNID